MNPVFILSYPRSRTAWLSVFLTGCGIPCIHEGWKYAKTAQELRVLMESMGTGAVVNSDCSNIFFLDELKQEFPEARYIVILNDDQAVVESLKQSYGDHDYTELVTAYRRAYRDLDVEPLMVLDCRTWSLVDSVRLAHCIGGVVPPKWWVESCSGLLVQLMPDQILRDIDLAHMGAVGHIHEHMRRFTWVS